MTDDDKGGDDNGGLKLRVDRLAAAMEAARARARAQADVPPPAEPARDNPAAPGIVGDARPARTGPADGAGQAVDAPRAGVTDPASDGSLSSEGRSPPTARTDQTRDDPEPVRGRAAVPDAPPPDPPPEEQRPLILTPDFHAPTQVAAPPGQPADAPGGDRAPGMAVSRAAAAAVPPERVAYEQSANPAQAAALLALTRVSTDIGRYRILADVTLDVPRGAVTVLLGRNGAGKTTTLRTIMGLWRARAGEIVFAGERIDRWATHRIARASIGYVPESMSIFADLTVAENIALGARAGPVARDRMDWLTGLFPPLATFWRSPAGNLSGGQKQMLALARALVERRRLYLIDEPTKGLAPAIVDTVVSALRDLKLQGATILMVEQNFAVARALGDACAVIDDGRVAWRGTMAQLADDPALQGRLMGLDLGDVA